MYKVVYIDSNFSDKRYPNTLSDGDKFYTYGFGSIYARKFKKYNPDVTVECWKSDSRIIKIYERTIQNVRYIIFPSKSIFKLGDYSFKLISHLKNELKTVDQIIFNISSIRHLLFYSLALRLKNYPLVVQHHGESSAIHKTKINTGLKKLYYALQIPIEKLCFKNIDLFFVLDERIKDYLPKSNKKLKVELSTTGVDEKIFYPIDKIEAKKLLGWDINNKHILYVGRLNYTKRPDLLIDIYKELKKEGRKDIVLVLAGNEKDDPLYENAVKSGAILYPKILQTELYKYLSAADMYILPLLSEVIPFGGIGMLSVQALLCNTPIVGSTVASFPPSKLDKVGIVASNTEGIKNAILEIIEMKKFFFNLRETAISYYSWENISKHTLHFYTQILKQYRS